MKSEDIVEYLTDTIISIPVIEPEYRRFEGQVMFPDRDIQMVAITVGNILLAGQWVVVGTVQGYKEGNIEKEYWIRLARLRDLS